MSSAKGCLLPTSFIAPLLYICDRLSLDRWSLSSHFLNASYMLLPRLWKNGDLSKSCSIRLKHWGKKRREKLLRVSFGITLFPPARAILISPRKSLWVGWFSSLFDYKERWIKEYFRWPSFCPLSLPIASLTHLFIAVFSGDRYVVQVWPNSFLCIRKGWLSLPQLSTGNLQTGEKHGL